MLTAEYLVLDGAEALAVPTKKGQTLSVEENDRPTLLWESRDENGKCWFTTSFPLPLSDYNTEDPIAKTLHRILKTAQELNPKFLTTTQGYTITTALEFHRQWGLGSSSTLINNIAQWADVNAFELLEKSFGGSGYDIACAQHHTPILYQRNPESPKVQAVLFDPPFKDQLFFIYLNTKQDSKASIQHYRALSAFALDTAIAEVNQLTQQLLNCTSLLSFETLVDTHEALISKIITTPTVKATRFPDYPRSIKSLGGWGGDFILVTGTVKDMDYFKTKGYTTIIPYAEMVL